MTQKQKQNIQISQSFKGASWLINRGRKLKSKLYLINRGIFGIIIVLSLYFVFSVNDLAIKGFVLQEVKDRTEVLQNENEQLALKVMEMESYENISKRASEIKMVKVGQIDYLTINDTNVAKK